MKATSALKQAIAQNPNDPALHYDLGGAYLAQFDTDNAMASYQKALALAPGHPQILLQLGNTASAASQHAISADYFQQCLQADPNNAGACYNLGNALRELGQLQAAVAAYQQALTLTPNDANTHNNLGNVFRELGQLDQAITCYQTALKHNPNLHHALAHLIHQKQHAYQWDGLDQEVKQLRTVLKQQPKAQIPPFAFLAMPSTTMAEQLVCASQWATQQFSRLIQAKAPYSHREKHNHKRIKVAYLSSDFRLHPLAFLITEMLAAHDATQFEVVAYSTGHDDSTENADIRNAVEQFIDITHMSDVQAAEHLYENQVDILVDLTGYTKNSRSGVIALKPAPISINWLGFPGTMGSLNDSPLYDYIFVDETIVPDPEHLSEKQLNLPCYQPNNANRPIGHAGAKSEHQLPENAFVFCCFNQTFKMTPDVFAVWMQLLENIPDSVLWLLECNQWAKQNLVNQAQQLGIDASRIIFAPRLNTADHLARHQHADLFLDTLPYNAHTTASDALWMGLPIVTCEGDTFASRVTSSLLKQVKLDQLITTDLSAYYEVAYAVATDPEKRQSLVDTLQNHQKLLFNPPTFVKNVEQHYSSLHNALYPT